MDVGFYLSKLLMQQGEVSIPGLGSFERLRMSGYYDENERTFYPPYHRAKFTIGQLNADSLADYIALKKNISGASAGYFVEKYVSNIKQEALTGEVAVGNLGRFYTTGGQLTFKPNDKIPDDSIFYGLEPVGIAKTNDTGFENIPVLPTEEVIEDAVIDESEPEIIAEPVVFENNYQAQPVEFYNKEDTAYAYVNNEPDERKSPLRIFLIVVVIILLLDTIILGIYRYDPDTFAKIAFWKNNTKVSDTVKQKGAIPIKVADTANTDSIETADAVKTDTLTKKSTPVTKETKAEKLTPVVAAKKTEQLVGKQPVAAAQKTGQPAVKQPVAITAKAVTALDTSALKPSDAVGTRRFEVYVLACKTMPTALRYSAKLRKKGLDPRIVTDSPGKLIHISIGHFATEKEAMAFGLKQANNGKVTTDFYPREIIPQK